MKEGEMLKKIKEKLEEENDKLKGDKELNEMMVQEKVVQTKNQKQQIRTVSFFLSLPMDSSIWFDIIQYGIICACHITVKPVLSDHSILTKQRS